VVTRSELPNWDHLDFDPTVSVRMTFASGVWIATELALNNTLGDPDTIARQITDGMIHGMARPTS
jgi:hypothetical protein